VQFHNLKLISSLRTAVSAKNAEWLEGVARAVETRHREGTLNAEEFAHFQRIIALARAGQWDAAHQEAFRFEEAQLSRRRPPPTPDGDHHHEARFPPGLRLSPAPN
jgi:fructoselysine-6-P-deglycase FrlB-like protein